MVAGRSYMHVHVIYESEITINAAWYCHKYLLSDLKSH